MSGFKNFAIVGAGVTGSFVGRQFLKDKAVGMVNEVVVLTRQVGLVGLTLIHIPLAQQLWQGSKTTTESNAKVIPVDYSDKESIKRALSGTDVVVSAIAQTALGLQTSFGMRTSFSLSGFLRYLNSQWRRSLGLDVTSGKVYVSGDDNKQVPFTSRPDIARYLSNVLTHLPAEQLNNRSFKIAGDTKVRG